MERGLDMLKSHNLGPFLSDQVWEVKCADFHLAGALGGHSGAPAS